MTLRFLDGAARALFSDVRERYPHEACGLLCSRAEEPDLIVRVRPLANAHLDPTRAFAFDDEEHLAAQRELRVAGELVRGFFHSHPDGEAALSPTDLLGALGGGEPLWPGVDWIVVATRGPRVTSVRRFRIGRDGAFEEPLILALP